MKNETNRNLPTATGSFFKRVIGLFMVLIIVLSSITISYVVASPVLTVLKSVNRANPYVGESFVYTIRYANPSTTENAEDVFIEDILPSNIEYVSHIVSSHVQSVSVTNNGTNDVVRFTFDPVLEAGSTGLIKIEARFPAGTTPETIGGNPNVAINTATIDLSNGDPVDSNPVTVTPRLNATSDWSIAKTRIIPASILPAVDNDVTYQVTVNSNSVIGGLDLKDIVITDTLPVGATFVSASDGGTYDSISGKVTWDIASLPVGDSQSFTVVINYPTPTFTQLSSVTNTVDGTATQFDDTPAPAQTDSVTHGFAVPTYEVSSFSKGNRQANDNYSVGQLARFYLSDISNDGNMPTDKIEITDDVPSEIQLTQISTGSYSVPCSVQVQYQTNLDTNLRTWTGSPFAVPPNTTLNVSALGLSSGEYVTQVKWTITAAGGQLLPGFTNTEALNLNGIASAPLVGNSITNTATLQAFNGATPFATLNASSTIYIIDQYPWLVPIKTVVGGNTRFNYNDTVTFNLRIQNHAFATGNYVDPIAVDTIPPEYEDITYLGWDAGNSSISAAPAISTTGTKTIGGVTYTLLTADFIGTLLPGQYVNVQYSAKIIDMTETGLLPNSLYISTLDNNTIYQNDSEAIADVNDLDGDGSTTDRFVQDEVSIFVNFQGALAARKYIQGANDVGFTDKRYPEYTYTYPGGYVNYRLVVKNTGSNGPITNVVLIDKLPTIGDTGVVDPSARNTQWTPYLVNLITGENGAALPAGVTVYYSTVVNPSCQEMDDPESHVNNPADLWSTTPPADITTVKSIKIDFGSIVMNTDDELVLEWPMRAPVGAPLGEIAWNSFAYVATYPDLCCYDTNVIQSPFLPSEPIKVGFEIQLPPPFDVGNFVWEDMNKNGIQDDGETGINNVLVNMYSKIGSNYVLYDYTRTGFDQFGNPGYYTFPEVPLGTYRMEFVYPKSFTDINGYTSTYSPSPDFAGTDILIDSNGNPATIADYSDLGIVKDAILTPDFTVSTADDFSIDQGLYRLSSIGDRVWYDYNADGIQTSGENGLAGVTVRLLDSAGNPAEFGDGSLVPAQTTNATGDYLFTDLEPGVYKVQFDIPSDYKLSPTDAGADDAIDSDAIKDTGATGTTADYTLLSGEQNLTVDAGMYLGSIGNLVFEDVNVDGIYNAGDSVLSGVTVNLYRNGSAYGTTTTNSSGIYLFDELTPGTYVVEVEKPGSYDEFTITTGTTPTIDNDSDVNRGTGRTEDIILAAGDRINTIDAGLYNFATIGNYVWNDRNMDGIQATTGEPGIGGVTVSLTDELGNPVLNGLGVPVADVVTDANGYYIFENLDPVQSKDYKVVFTNPNQDYKFSPNNGAVTLANNSDGIWINDTDPTATTGTISIESGSNINYADQGLYLGHIGNLVFEDFNVDGLYNAGDDVISGVTVNLYKDGNPVVFATTTTNSSGIYSFDDLFPGDYVVEVIKPTGYSEFTLTSGTTPAVDNDSDVNRLTGSTSNIALTAGQRIDTIDAGMYKYAAIGNYVWNDRNMNGIQDAGEPGIEGVNVSLTDAFGGPVVDGYGNPVTDVLTDANGNYIFENLDPEVSKTYRVVFTNPNQDYKFSPTDQGANDNTDSDGVWVTDTDATATTNIVEISSGTLNESVDQGLYLGHIGNLVFEDVDVDGIYNAGDTVISGVTVNLYKDGNPAVFATTTTNSSGIYSFDDLFPGDYVVEVIKPAAYDKFTTTTGTTPGTDDDSDVDRTTGRTSNIVLAAGERIDTIDAGLYNFASIGNYVWNDQNMNGIQDSGEPGIEGVTVSLTDALGSPVVDGYGNPVADVLTDANGNYIFENLDPVVSKEYRVVFTNPDQDYKLSPTDAGGNDNTDSDGIWVTDTDPTATTDIIEISSGSVDNSVDQGMYLGHIGNLVFEDVDVDGIYNAGDTVISGVTVNLYKYGNPAVFATTTTNSSGIYSFDDLFPGDYVVEVIKPAAYDKFTTTTGTTPGTDNDSDVDRTTGRTSNIVLAAGERIDTIDAGLYQFATIGNYVWNDRDMDGVQESGEPGIEGVTVSLADALGSPVVDGYGNPVADVLTDANGNYIFENLDPVVSKTYRVVFTNPNQDYKFSPTNAGGNDNMDSDGIWTTDTDPTATTNIVEILSGTVDNSVDQGMYLGHVGNLVFHDVNVDGVFNAGDAGISGATVNLYKDGNPAVFATTTTNSSGIYSFDDLFPGTYVVEVIKPALYPKFTMQSLVAAATTNNDSDVDRTTGRTGNIVITAGERTDNVDAGLYRYARIGDRVWLDTDLDGIQDAGEVGISGVTVRLTDAAGNPVLNGLGVVVADVVTNASGNYSFTNLDPLVSKTYRVEFINPGQDYALSPSNGAVTVTNNSDGKWTNSDDLVATTDIISVISNSNRTYVDQGMYLGVLGDFVWDDYNANGRQDAGEPGISGVTVSLLDAVTGLPATNINGVAIPATTTNSSGAYRFESLTPGDYIVQFSMPTGWDVASVQYAAIATDTTDSNADVVTYQSDTVTLAAGQRDLSIDAGFFGYAKLGDRIWNDLNANGVQDAGEPGIVGATVHLLDGGGAVIETIVTDANGDYLFDDLVPNTYAVRVDMPAGYDSATLQYQGATTADSNLDTTTLTSENITLISRQDDRTFDGGFYIFASLSNFIWDDLNEDGIQDTGEPGFENVAVDLYDEFDNLLDTDITDVNGEYLFDGLVPGNYYIKVTRPADYIFTLQNSGSDITVDSNADEVTGESELVFLYSGDNDVTFDVGLRLATPAIDIEKHVSLDGGITWHDADTPKGPQYDSESGINPRFKFVVTNTGNTRLTDIVVEDDVFGTITPSPISLMMPGEIWESSIITQVYDFSDLVQTGPVDWIDNLNVSLSETSTPKDWDFRSFAGAPHDEGSWIIGTNHWSTGNWYYLGVIQPGETVELPLSVLLDEELTTNEYMGATFYLQPKFEAIQITNEAVYDAWGMGYLPDIDKWLPTTFNVGNSRWEATDNDSPPPETYFWDTVLKLWDLIT